MPKLADVFSGGKGKGGGDASPPPDPDLAVLVGGPEDGGMHGMHDEDGEFETHITEAFPDLEGKPDRIAAFRRAIEAVM